MDRDTPPKKIKCHGYSADRSAVCRAIDGRIIHQVITLMYWGANETQGLKVELRFDDKCGNGHESFAATGSGYGVGGMCHEDILQRFPKLWPLLKWHCVSTDGPMHYIANCVYHAGNRDCWGLLKGEERQIINGKTKLPAWKLSEVTLPKYVDAETCPEGEQVVSYVPWNKVGDGKERQLMYARSNAVWPEATDEQLCLPKEELTKLLMDRHPKLIRDFKSAMLKAGFEWPDREGV